MIDRASVRMYKVGFGDCFLLRFWSGDQPAGRVLIDCGSLTEGKARVDRVVADIIETCTQDGVARIDLVVGTHRHRDHVGGFSNPAWAGVEVGEVWLPWTEDPDDPDATRIRERQSSLATALAAAAGLDADDEPLAAPASPRETDAAADLRAIGAMALNALTNEKAMATLHGGFASRSRPVFLPLKNTPCEARAVAGLEGLRIHVLGPPRDTRAMAAMDPPDGAGYLAAATAARSGGRASPFSRRWVMTDAEWRKDAGETTFRPSCRLAVDAIAGPSTGALAAALDNALNNTSLILMFEVAGQWLLFPADAQWGAWDAALRQPAARAVLEKTTFYKVGHHGSHNATPRELIEQVIPEGFTAMLSTSRVKQWPQVPRGPLVDAIVGKAARCARSDDDVRTAAAGFEVDELFVDWDFPPPGTRPTGGGDGGGAIRNGSNQERPPMTTIIACTPKHLPRDRLISAAANAVKTTPPATPGLVAARSPLAVNKAFLAVLKAKRWQTNGVRLTVGFLDDPPADLRARIVQHMNAWNKTADVLFTETNGQADVRIARIPEDGYWSYLGTDILLIDKDQPTMNLEGFTMNTRDSEFYRVVRHETGHTLGFPHEHMRRELVEKIDRTAALRYYGSSQGWTDEEIEAQVLTPIEESSLLGTERSDSDSIMCYQVPGALTVDGKAIPGGEDIDELDYEFAGQCYPKPDGASCGHDHG